MITWVTSPTKDCPHSQEKGLSQVSGLNVQDIKAIKFKPKPWLSPFMNTGPAVQNLLLSEV